MKSLIIGAVFALAYLNGINCEDQVNYANLSSHQNFSIISKYFDKNILKNLSVSSSPRTWTCSNRCCRPICAMAGLSGGVCRNGRCDCEKIPATRVCHAKCCQELCTQEGHIMGKCDENQECECFQQIQGTCNNRDCNQHCAVIGSDKGSCHCNICQCAGATSVFVNLFLLFASCVVLLHQEWL
jgi:hypothetical protein